MKDAVGKFRHGPDQQSTGHNLAKAERRVRAFGNSANHASSLTAFIATAVMTCCGYVLAIPTYRAGLHPPVAPTA